MSLVDVDDVMLSYLVSDKLFNIPYPFDDDCQPRHVTRYDMSRGLKIAWIETIVIRLPVV